MVEQLTEPVFPSTNIHMEILRYFFFVITAQQFESLCDMANSSLFDVWATTITKERDFGVIGRL